MDIGYTGWLLTRRPSGPFAVTLSLQLNSQILAYIYVSVLLLLCFVSDEQTNKLKLKNIL